MTPATFRPEEPEEPHRLLVLEAVGLFLVGVLCGFALAAACFLR